MSNLPESGEKGRLDFERWIPGDAECSTSGLVDNRANSTYSFIHKSRVIDGSINQRWIREALTHRPQQHQHGTGNRGSAYTHAGVQMQRVVERETCRWYCTSRQHKQKLEETGKNQRFSIILKIQDPCVLLTIWIEIQNFNQRKKTRFNFATCNT